MKFDQNHRYKVKHIHSRLVTATRVRALSAAKMNLMQGDPRVPPATKSGLSRDLPPIPIPIPFTTNPSVVHGARPVFADVRTATLTLDPSAIEPLITRRTKAIIPVHFAGVGCETDRSWRSGASTTSRSLKTTHPVSSGPARVVRSGGSDPCRSAWFDSRSTTPSPKAARCL